ncbi:MAG: hypothetical protein QXY70_01150 [Nanopusillaceae archaeon]
MIQNNLIRIFSIISIVLIALLLAFFFKLPFLIILNFVALTFISEFLRNKFLLEEYLILKSLNGLTNIFLIVYYFLIEFEAFLLGLFIGLSSYTMSEILKAFFLLKLSKQSEALKIIEEYFGRKHG